MQSDGDRFKSQAGPCSSNLVSLLQYSSSTGKCWVEFVRVHCIKADRDSRVKNPPILNLHARWMSVVSLTPWPFYPCRRTRLPNTQVAGLVPQHVWKIRKKEKNLPQLSEIKPRTFQPLLQSVYVLRYWDTSTEQATTIWFHTSNLRFSLLFLSVWSQRINRLKAHLLYFNFYMFRALEVHHQEVNCNHTCIMVWCVSKYVLYGESAVCGYTWMAIEFILVF
jgi:hypothetical protein